MQSEPFDVRLISREALALMDRLLAHGHQAFLVGGCLRDIMRGVTPHDWDLATTAHPDEVLSIFPGALPTGLAHGTVTVVAGALPVEITTCRKEGAYRDHRRPDEVFFTNRIEEDLARRDFTINALAWSADGGLIDPFGGRADLVSRLLRCVGNPMDRLEEDALRILRALRFAATLDLTVDGTLDAALRRQAGLLRHVAAERIWAELVRLLSGVAAERVLVGYADILELIVPAADPSGIDGRPLALVPRLAWLLRKLAPEEAGRLVRILRGDRKTERRVRRTLSFAGADTRNLTALLHSAGEETARDVLHFHGCDTASLDEFLMSGICWHTSGLSIGGDDLIVLGFPPGPMVGNTLALLLCAVMDRRCPNRREDLLALAADLKNLSAK